MSRSGYSEDGDFDQWSMIRWRGAVASAFGGTRGQDFLKEMVDALDALPERRLIAEDLERVTSPSIIFAGDVPIPVYGSRDVCAIGAVGLARRMDMSKINPEEYEQVASRFGIAPVMAQEIVWVNDDEYARDTPERRWFRMRRWIVMQIKGWSSPESDLMMGESG